MSLSDETVELILKTARVYASKYRQQAPRHVDVDDLRQAACLRMLTNLEKHDPVRGSLATFLSCQAYYGVLDYARQVDWFPRLWHESHRMLGMRALEDSEEDPRDSFFMIDVQDELEFWMSYFPERERRVLREYYIGHKTMQTIAKESGCSVSWISLMHRDAMRRLRWAAEL